MNHFSASFVHLCECIEGVCLGKMHGIFIYLFSSASGGEIPEGKHQRAFRCGTALSSRGKAKHSSACCHCAGKGRNWDNFDVLDRPLALATSFWACA